MKPINLKVRIDILDYLRGFALLGIILVNSLTMLSVTPPVPQSADAAYQGFLFLFVEGRFYAIFSFLFGVGFYLFISRANEKGNNGYLLFLRRIIALFLFGFIHLFYQPGEALTVYASCGLLILPFYKMKKAINLFLGIILLIVTAAFSLKIIMTFPLVLLGLTAGQYRLFERISQITKRVIVFTLVMFLFGSAGIIYQVQVVPVKPINIFTQSPLSNRFLGLGIMIGPFVSAFYAGLFILFLNNRFIRKLLSPLKSCGRMALTNYLMQTALVLMTGSVFHLTGHISYLQTFYLCIAILVIQLIFSCIWLSFFRFGPFEWIWRFFTYMKIP